MKKLLTPFLISLTFLLFMSCSSLDPVNVWMIGDSTMSIKEAKSRPETGWGESVQQFMNESATVHDHAMNGRSSRSFISEGRWQNVFDSIQAGDFVIIQFGHNDQKPDTLRHTDPFSTYKQTIKFYIEQSRSKGANPIVCSSIVRRHFDSTGTLIDTHGDYIVAAKEIAVETNTPYVDMEKLSRKLVSDLGPEKSKQLYKFFEPGQFPNYPNGKQDSTHLNPEGAKAIASLFVEEVENLNLPLKEYFK